MFIFLPLILILSSCGNSEPEKPSYYTQEIPGRDAQHTRIYRVRIPAEWNASVNLPSDSESLEDTKKALCELSIDGKIRITIHNFPSNSLNDRIPAGAQISRWKKQFENLIPTSIAITPQAFSGYVGFLFQGSGKLNGHEATMLGWSMSLPSEYYQTMSSKTSHLRGDFTIKATGPVAAMEQHHDEIIAFARSFELIEEIPSQ